MSNMEAPPQNPTADKAAEGTPVQSTKGTELLVLADIPDIDNFKIILSFLKRNPTRKVNIVLSPRPVDFGARWYGTEDERKVIAGKLPPWNGSTFVRLLTPYQKVPNWVGEIKDEEIRRTYFERPDPPPVSLLEDTKVYMEVSFYRLVNFLEKCGIAQSQYEVYWDDKSLGSNGVSDKIQHGMRSCYHAPDYAYDFEDAKRAHALSTAKQNIGPTARRETLTGLCTEYINAQKIKHPVKQLRSFEILENSTSSLSTDDPVMVGGPFTELVKLIKAGFVPKLIVAMAGSVDGRGNLFPNQFNIHVDFNSAWKLFTELAKKHGIRIRLLPTEACKKVTRFGADYDYKIPEARFTTLLTIDTMIAKAVKRLATVMAKARGIDAWSEASFDWIAAVMPQIPWAFPLKYVEPWKARRVIDQGKMIFEEVTEGDTSNENRAADIVMRFRAVEESSQIQMWWPIEGDRAEEARVKDLLIEQFAFDLTVS